MKAPSVLGTLLLVAACTTNTAPKTGPTFVPATLIEQLPSERPPRPPVQAKPARTGASAIIAAQRKVVIKPVDREVKGNTWVIENVRQDAVYEVYTSPMQTSTFLLPPGEAITAASIGTAEDFTKTQAVTNNRGAVSVKS